MCRTCKAENPKWSKGVRVPVKDLPLFFASQPSWNFEQKIYGHNVVVTERARPTLTGRLGCHDIEGVVHRRQDHFLVREIFHCPGKKYNCSPRLACTGRRRHCYGLCKVTVYSANKDVAIVQFAGSHGTGAIQRRVWPYNQYENISPDSPPRDMTKKESKMRTIFGSPTKDDGNWQKFNKSRNKNQHNDMSAFKQPLKNGINLFKDEENLNMNDLNNFYQPRLGNMYTQNAMISCPTPMLYPSPPGYEGEQDLLTPHTSPEERVKLQQHQQHIQIQEQHVQMEQELQHQTMTSCAQIAPYNFYPTHNLHNTLPNVTQSPQNFWNASGMLMNNFPITPPPIKPEMFDDTDRTPPTLSLAAVGQKLKKSPMESDYIPTLSDVNCRTDDIDQSQIPGFSTFDMSPNLTEPYQKRRKLEQPSVQPLQTTAPNLGVMPNMPLTDIWRPYLHQQEYCDMMNIKPEHNNSMFNINPENMGPLTSQDNLISFMLRGDDNNHNFYRDSQKILANMSNGLQLTKL